MVATTYSLAYCEKDWAARAVAGLAAASLRLSALAAPAAAEVTVESDRDRCSLSPPPLDVRNYMEP